MKHRFCIDDTGNEVNADTSDELSRINEDRGDEERLRKAKELTPQEIEEIQNRLK